jgi:hypothetical protein
MIPFTVQFQCRTEGEALLLWAALACGDTARRVEVERHAGPAALAKYDVQVELGLSEGLYPLFNKLTDMLREQGVINA